jgi:Protein of unknown function (DUF3575)
MKPKSPNIIFVFLGLLTCNLSLAQSDPNEKPGKSDFSSPLGDQKNIVKVNVAALFLNNISFQYERVINKKMSAALGIRVMPKKGLPFKNSFVNIAGASNPDAVATINGLRVSNFAITPEFRFYVGKNGYGKGFYIAPFYRYASFKSDDLPINYTNANNQTNTLTLKGDIKANSAGIMFGAQWFLGGALTLDWWIVGANYGSSKGTFTGKSSIPLTTEEQNDLKTTIDDFTIPLVKKTSVVNANGATINISGPWAGIRGGISIGFRF